MHRYRQLKPFFQQEDHLHHFLCHFDLDGIVQAIRSIDSYFQEESEAAFFVSQAEDALHQVVSDFGRVDAEKYVDDLSYYEDFSASDLESHIFEVKIDELEYALDQLPERFDHLEADDFYDETEICGADDAVANFYGSWDYEESFHRNESVHGVMDPVDAIFQR